MPRVQDLLPPPPMAMGDAWDNFIDFIFAPLNAAISLISGSTDMGIRERFAERGGTSPEALAAEMAARAEKTRRTGFSVEGNTIIF